jgi:hypothetical protein
MNTSTFFDHLMVTDFEPSLEALAPYAKELFRKVEEAEIYMAEGKCDFIEIGIVKGEVSVWRVHADGYWKRDKNGRAIVF